jgi:hypothetical protein
MRVGSTLTVVACTLALASGLAGANSLDLRKTVPDITSVYTLVNYHVSGSTGTFTADGYADSLDLDGLAPPDYQIPYESGPTFHIDMTLTLDPGTDAITSATGNLAITSTVSEVGATSGTLLTGTLFRFGYIYNSSNPSSTFQFVFNVPQLPAAGGGDLAAMFGPTAAVSLELVTGFGGTFNSGFTNDTGFGDGLAVSDTFSFVPEPVTLLGVLLGTGSLAGYLRRRVGARAPGLQ